MVTGGEDKLLYLWKLVDTENGVNLQQIAKLQGHKKQVASCVFSPDNTKILSGGKDSRVFEWNAKTAKMLHNFKRHEATVNGVAYTSDQKYIVSGATDTMVIFTDAQTKEEVCAFACRGRVTCLAAHGRRVISGDGSGALYVLEPHMLPQ